MSQLQAIRKHLEDKGSITPMQALSLYGCYRLGARISDLRKEGMNIVTDKVRNKKGGYYAKYVLENED